MRNPGQLVELLQKYPGEPRGNGYWTEASYLHFCKNNTVFSGIIGFSWDRLLRARTEHGVQRIITGEYVTANYFDVLGLQPALGRLIGPEDVHLGSPVAVVSWAYWKSELNGNPNVVGERMYLQKELVTVVGVAPHAFVGPFPELPTDVWLPKTPSRQSGIGLIARLKPGATVDQARAEMAVLYTSRDQSDGGTVIINETFKRRYFAGRDPIAKRITLYQVTLDPEPKTYEVIGVVADAHYSEIREQANGAVYLPAFHDGVMSANNLVIRSNNDPERLIRDVRVTVERIMGGRIPVKRITTLNAQIDASIVPERLIALLSGFFAGLGALLVGIGIYALLAYRVARRTKEIGIRVALGATIGHVRRMVLGDTILVVLAGIAAGAPLAIAGRRLALRLMQDLTVQSMAPVLVGGLGLVLIALVASYIPLTRASGTHPLEALRHE